jgi:polyisoprenoid-binding protein YceI
VTWQEYPRRLPSPNFAEYAIEAGMSRFTVRGFAGELLSGLGRLGHNPVVAVRDFAGDAHWDPAEPQRASRRLRIRATALAVRNDINDKDRREMERVMREEVLETDKYPEIAFESTSASANPKWPRGH